jgi:hypothetical protein
VKRLEEERVDLIGKIEAGAGVETAISQLNQEKVTALTFNIANTQIFFALKVGEIVK